MKLEEMSAEELVNDSIHNPATEALRANKAELLRRLSEGERAKTRLEQDATNWKILWDGAQEEIERLKKENEELAQYNWKLLSENSGFSNLVADLKKRSRTGRRNWRARSVNVSVATIIVLSAVIKWK